MNLLPLAHFLGALLALLFVVLMANMTFLYR
jgi:hypothetical protein